MTVREIQELYRQVRSPGHANFYGGNAPPSGSATRELAVMRWVLHELDVTLDMRCQTARTRYASVTFTSVRSWQTGYVINFTFRHSGFTEQFQLFIVGLASGRPAYQIDLIQQRMNRLEWSQPGNVKLRGGQWYCHYDV